MSSKLIYVYYLTTLTILMVPDVSLQEKVSQDPGRFV